MNYSRSVEKILMTAFLILFFCSCKESGNSSNQKPSATAIKKIRVVMDSNYPPFIFIDSEGKQQGILIDQWKLWEQKTGVETEVTAMDWHEALAAMETGKFEVIDTIFSNEKREVIYDFTKPYANIDVPIFFNKKISGIKDADTAKGFSIAIKKGDNAANILKQHDIESLQEFDSYEEIIRQAKENRITVFVMDAPPAFYFLYKMGIQDDFKYTKPLYTGSFHRAVAKGNKELADLVDDGFSRISKSEYTEINEKWFGSRSLIIKNVLLYAISVLIFFIIVTLLLFLWSRALKRQVSLKTMALEKEIELNTKKTEELSESEELFRSTLDSMDDLVFIFDSESRFTAFHQPTKRSELLIPPEVFIGKSIYEVGLPDDAVKGYNSALEKLKKNGKPQSYEYSVNIYGDNKWFSARLSDRRGASGNFDGATAVIRDITARRNLELERERILSDLEIKNIELEKIIYIASHDLRSPLLNIHGFSKRLEKNMAEISEILSRPELTNSIRNDIQEIVTDKAKNALGYITASVSRMDALINGLLRLSRSGGKEPVKVKLDINEIIEKIIASMHFQIEAAGATINIENLLPCRGDYSQISQVFSNVIDNSIKYRDPERPLQITIKSCSTNGFVTYSITDNGKGIAKENLNRIWDVFQRVDVDPQVTGDGLGLSISKKILEKHGCKASLESKINVGSTFFISLEAAHTNY